MTKALCNWKEADLIEWLKENIYPDLVKAKNQMSRWDCYSPEAHHRIELKCRRKHYDTLLIERGKYEAVLLESKKHLDIPLFIASTPEGVFSFNLLIVNFEDDPLGKNNTSLIVFCDLLFVFHVLKRFKKGYETLKVQN